MKLINKYIGLTILSVTLLSSCSDNFLQKNSLTESSSETFWKTPNDAFMGLTACYDALQNNQLYNSNQYTFGPLYMECLTDNGGHFNWSGWIEGYDVAMGIQTPSSSLFEPYWKASYEVINRCNSLIANIDKIDMSVSDKAQYKAEATVLRSLIYTNLTMTYQDVPYITEPLNINKPSKPQSKRAEIVENVINDLKNNINNLPEKADLGRITRGAGYAILGRLALYNQKWDEAINAYREVMKLGYSLAPKYSELFTLKGQTSPEIIFSVRYEGPGLKEGASFNAHWNTPGEFINGTIDLADDFYMTNGKKTTDTNYGTMEDGKLVVGKPNAEHWKNRDPRLYSTLFVPGMKWNGKGGAEAWYGGANPSNSTVYVMKYFNPEDTGNSWDNGQDFYVVRYAEVLLSLAEALVEKGGYDENEVYNLIDQIRQRSDVNMPKVEDVEGRGLSKDALLQVIRHERRVELAFEGLRLFDLYRWKTLDKAVANIEKERTTLGLPYEKRQFNGDRDYVWPIPTAEIDADKNLKQNDLWK